MPRHHLLPALLLLLASCSAPVDQPDSAIPAACRAHTAREFRDGSIACAPAAADTCAFDAHNAPTPLDGSGAPLAYYCTCDGGGSYWCWGAPGLAKAEPLP